VPCAGLLYGHSGWTNMRDACAGGRCWLRRNAVYAYRQAKRATGNRGNGVAGVYCAARVLLDTLRGRLSGTRRYWLLCGFGPPEHTACPLVGRLGPPYKRRVVGGMVRRRTCGSVPFSRMDWLLHFTCSHPSQACLNSPAAWRSATWRRYSWHLSGELAGGLFL